MPFRPADAPGALSMIEGGLDDMRPAFCKARDIGGDGVRDDRRLEGPERAGFLDGAPHAHRWVHVRQGARARPASSA